MCVCAFWSPRANVGMILRFIEVFRESVVAHQRGGWDRADGKTPSSSEDECKGVLSLWRAHL